MDYVKCYNKLIITAQINPRSEGESHHIIPRCEGGSDEKYNLVKLSIREHKIAHLLLAKIYPNSNGLKYAANLFSGKRLYSSCWNKGKTNIYSPETIEKIRKSKLGKALSLDHKRKISKNSTVKKKVMVFEAICKQFRKKNQPSIYQKGKFIQEFESTIAVAKFLSIPPQNVHRVIRGVRPQCKGYIFEYSEVA